MNFKFDNIKKKLSKFMWKKQKCARCGQIFRYPLNKGKLKIKCPSCKQEYLFDPDMVKIPDIMRTMNIKIKSLIPRNAQKNFYGIICIFILCLFVINYIISFFRPVFLNPFWFMIPFVFFYYIAIAFDINKKIAKYSFYIFLILIIIVNIFRPNNIKRTNNIPNEFIKAEKTIDI